MHFITLALALAHGAHFDGDIPTSGVDIWLAALQSEVFPIGNSAERLLYHAGEYALPVYQAALVGDDGYLRLWAAARLAAGGARSEKVLLSAMAHGGEDVREKATSSLFQLLVARTEKDRVPPGGFQRLVIVSEYRPRVETLLKLLQHENELIRSEAVGWFCAFGPEVRPALLDLYRRSEGLVQRSVVSAMHRNRMHIRRDVF